MSNCVGKRNHKYFYLFLLFTTFLAMYLVAASAIALGLRIKVYQPIGVAFGWSVVSIILGIYAILIMLNVGGMCISHTYYLILEYTTNERIKKRYKTKDNKMINPFAQRNMLLNCVNMLCGPVRPSYFNFTERVDRNVYERAEVLQSDLRRRNMAASYSSESLIPVPGSQFMYELMKKRLGDNAMFKDELNILNTKYVQAENGERRDGTVLYIDSTEDETVYHQINKRIKASPNLNFFYEVSIISIWYSDYRPSIGFYLWSLGAKN